MYNVSRRRNKQLRRVAKKLLYYSNIVGNAILVFQEIVLWVEILWKASFLQESQQTIDAAVDSITQLVRFPVNFHWTTLALPQPRVLQTNFTRAYRNCIASRPILIAQEIFVTQTIRQLTELKPS